MVRPEDSPFYLMVFSVTSYSGLVFPVDTRAFTYFYCQVSDDEEDKLREVKWVGVNGDLITAPSQSALFEIYIIDRLSVMS